MRELISAFLQKVFHTNISPYLLFFNAFYLFDNWTLNKIQYSKNDV